MIVRSYVVQPGFEPVAAGYVWWRDDYKLLDRIQVPSIEGFAVIGLGVIGYEVAQRAVTPVLPMSGLSHGAHGGTTVKWRALSDHPEIIAPGGVATFVVVTPIEEILYGGMVHDTLEPAIGSFGRVLVGGLPFGGMHLLLSGGVVSTLFTSIFGVLPAACNERRGT